MLAHRRALRLVGGDTLASFVYGVETVALLFVSARVGLSSGGYGVLLGAAGVGGVLGTALAPRLVGRPRTSVVMAGALLTIAVPLPLLAVSPWLVCAALWAAIGGAGAMVVEVLTETALQTELDEAVLGRAYGFAFPVSIGGICLGGAVAAPLIAAIGLTAALSVVGALVAAYAGWLVRSDAAAARPAVVSLQPAGVVTGADRSPDAGMRGAFRVMTEARRNQ